MNAVVDVVTGSEPRPLMDERSRVLAGRMRSLSHEKGHDFHDMMASQQSVAQRLLEQVLPLSPGIETALCNGIEVLDIGCGEGKALASLATAFPSSSFTGLDMCENAVLKVRAKASKRNLGNLKFATCDPSDWAARNSYDLITVFDAIHDQPDPAGMLANIHRALKPGGTLLMQGIAGSSDMEMNWDRTEPQSLERALRILRAAGFEDVEVKAPQDLMNVYYICWKS